MALLALGVLLLSSGAPRAAASAAPGACTVPVPAVAGVDQSPTNPAEYGACTDAVEEKFHTTSNWCLAPGFNSWPSGPAPMAQACAKFGRVTVYRGPVLGKEPAHKGACDVPLEGSDTHALVAVSTKYIKSRQGGWHDDPGACGMCMCVRLQGCDDVYNPHPNRDNVLRNQGLAFAARVGDRCGECEDDHVDVLLDRPFAYAPYDAARLEYDGTISNRHAPLVNRLMGLRGFSDPQALRGGPSSTESVGVYTGDWQWAPCSMTHADCGTMFQQMGYAVQMPRVTPGINSDTLEPITSPAAPRSRR
ncbi:MAG: hypothetical protein J3K34DRAFT_521733 [Monoraphidium minutum]|nr:MAG: hypothetical protein J3K34DRAFT_521733 [Monoraphidium minutum]